MGRLSALVIAVALTASAAGCSGSPDDSGGRVKVGAISIVDVAPLYLGQQKGFFGKQNLKLSVTPTTGGAAAVPGVVSGQFDFAFGNIASLLVARERGLDLKVVANGVASTGRQGRDFGALLVRNDSPVKTARDLSGKSVSVNNLDNIGDTTVRASVRKAGGDPGSIRFRELAFPDAPAALRKGDVDAIWVVEPFLTQARSQGARVVAWNFADTAPDLTIAAYFTTGKTVRDDPDLVKRFTTAINESLAYAQSHLDEAREILKSYTKISPELISRITMPAWPPAVNRQSVQVTADLALRDGLLKKRADVDALLS